MNNQQYEFTKYCTFGTNEDILKNIEDIEFKELYKQYIQTEFDDGESTWEFLNEEETKEFIKLFYAEFPQYNRKKREKKLDRILF